MTGRILHFGPGNFHRAHQAIFTQQASGWTITGVSLKSAGTRDALAGQAFDYTLVIRDADGERMERMTVLDDILVAPENPDAVLDTLADGSVQVVTVTVTEKGYHLNADGRLNLSDPEVAADLDTDLPRTLVGYLARGLMRRQIDMAGPISVISCDNLSGNGAKLRAAVMDFAQAAGLGLTLSEATFPDTMVDRITP
ncbi:MAG: mannitol dehydrogenase family protein, partial [Jannaschia helgolandensis]